MQQGRFYFVSDTFYQKYDKGKELMQNKETVNGKELKRPCFFAFPDSRNSDIYWCVPISSRVAKYKKIVEHKIQTQISKGVKNPKCNTIRFGDVMGQERAFLIQNMFPVTQKYIDAVYIDKNTKNEVTVSPQVESDVVKNARSILKLSFKHKHLVFGDIQKIYMGLSLELQQQKEQQENNVSNVSAINTSATTNTQSSASGIQSQYYLMKVTNKEMEALKKEGIPFQPSLKGDDGDGKTCIRFDKSLKERAVEIIKSTSKQSIEQPKKS